MRVFLFFAFLVFLLSRYRPEYPWTAVALKGLDPVQLVDGRKTPGRPELMVARGAFQYQFINEEDRKLFQGSPDRYEIQLRGDSVMMPPGNIGNPAIFAVYDKRIYIFTSQQQMSDFLENPEKHLADYMRARERQAS